MKKDLEKFRVGMIYFLMAIPVLLPLVFGELRTSISAFAEASNPNVLPILLTATAMAYFIDAVLSERRYNLLLAVSLIFVALFTHTEAPVLHYVAAGLYFIGNSFFAIKYTTSSQRGLMVLMFGVPCVFLLVSKSLVFTYAFYLAESILVWSSGALMLGEVRGWFK